MAKHPTNHPTMPLSIFFIIAVVAGFSSCGILSSDDPPELESGPRNYEWTVDSVYSAPGGWMNTIWGSSPNDVWIASGGGYEKLWHFDGREWAPYPDRFVGDFYSIYGFTQDNVWMGSNEGKIFHFDGGEWKLFQTYEKEGYYISSIRDIWGTAPSDIYAVGIAIENKTSEYRGFLLHFDGNKWRELYMTDFWVQPQWLCQENDSLLILGSRRIDGEPRFLCVYRYSNHRFIEILSKSSDEAEYIWVNNIGGEVYYIVGEEIQQRKKGGFKTILSIIEEDLPIGLDGRHKKDMFITTESGVLHYNGENTQYLFELENKNATVFRSLVLENDVFFLVNDYDAGTNLIYHGTLTKNEQEDE